MDTPRPGDDRSRSPEPSAEAAASQPGTGQVASGDYRYDAFISYSHKAGGRLAPALQQGLQRFAKPWYRPRAMRVFRDQTSLSASPALWPTIEDAILSSRFFILMASPAAAQSPWVQKEIACWLERRGTDGFLIVETDGEVKWDYARGDFDWERTDALTRDILEGKFSDSPLRVDLSWANREEQLDPKNPRFLDAVVTLASAIHGRPKDELFGEDIRLHKRARQLAGAAVMALLALAVGLAIASVLFLEERDDARTAEGIARDAQGTAQTERDQALKALARQMATTALNDEDFYTYSLLQSLEVARIDPEAYNAKVLAPKLLQKRPRLSGFLHDHDTLAVTRRSCFTAQDTKVAGKTMDGTVVIWDTESRQVAARLSASPEQGRIACSNASALIASSGYDNGAIVLWNAEDFTEAERLSGHGEQPIDLAFSPDGTKLASTDGSTFFIWDTTDFSVEADNQSLSVGAVSHLAYSSNGQLLAIASRDGDIFLKAEDSNNPLEPILQLEDLTISEMALNHDGTMLAVATGRGDLGIWNLETGDRIQKANPYSSQQLDAVEFTPDGSWLYAGGTDDYIWAIDLREDDYWDSDEREPWNPDLVLSLAGPYHAVTSLAFTSDGSLLASNDGFDGSIALWNVSYSGFRIGDWAIDYYHPLFGVALTADGSTLATGNVDGTVVIWDYETLQCQRVLYVGTSAELDCQSLPRSVDPDNVEIGLGLKAVKFSRSNDFLAVGHRDGTVRLWDLTEESQAPTREFVGHNDSIVGMAFSSDDETLATVDGSGTLIFWDIPNAEMRGEPYVLEDGEATLAVDDAGKWLATAGQEVQIWDLITAMPEGDPISIPASRGGVTVMAFDGEELYAVLGGREIVKWNLETGEVGTPRISHPHSDTVSQLTAGPDYLISAGLDGMIALYPKNDSLEPIIDLNIYLTIRENAPSTFSVFDIVLTPDGQQLIAATLRGVVIWNLNEEYWHHEVCTVANRNFTIGEWKEVFGEAIAYRKTCPQLPVPNSLIEERIASGTPETIHVGTPGPENEPIAAVR